MKSPARARLFRITVPTTSEAEEAVVELLTNVLGRPASVYSDTERCTTSVMVYVDRFSATERERVRVGLRAIREAGLKVGSGRISVASIRRENWAESWKRHFKPLEIGPRLLVLPSWSKRKSRPGQAVVRLDPGLSFGTGHHPTTAFCLDQIAAFRDGSRSQSLLDVGCGSGILSIAAAKLGYRPVLAFDFDPDAVRVARENAGMNEVRVRFSREDLTRLPVRSRERFNLVCANLVYDLLIQERNRILARVSPQGTLVLAGILRKQFRAVRLAYEESGWRLVTSAIAREWRSGAFRRWSKTPHAVQSRTRTRAMDG